MIATGYGKHIALIGVSSIHRRTYRNPECWSSVVTGAAQNQQSDRAALRLASAAVEYGEAFRGRLADDAGRDRYAKAVVELSAASVSLPGGVIPSVLTDAASQYAKAKRAVDLCPVRSGPEFAKRVSAWRAAWVKLIKCASDSREFMEIAA